MRKQKKAAWNAGIKFANLVLNDVGGYSVTLQTAMSYLAGILEARNCIDLAKGRISVRMKGKIPDHMKTVWGGTVFQDRNYRWFQSRRETTCKILEAVFPYLIFEKETVEKFLTKQ